MLDQIATLPLVFMGHLHTLPQLMSLIQSLWELTGITRHYGLPRWCIAAEPSCQCEWPERLTWVRSLGREDPLEEGMATHPGILSWRIPWIEEPGGLQTRGSQREGHDWSKLAHIHHHEESLRTDVSETTFFSQEQRHSNFIKTGGWTLVRSYMPTFGSESFWMCGCLKKKCKWGTSHENKQKEWLVRATSRKFHKKRW